MPKPDLGDTPAFARPLSNNPSLWPDEQAQSGMTLRQHYVGQALSGIIASYAGTPMAEQIGMVVKAGGPEAFADIVGKAAVLYANAVIRALETPP